MVIDAALRSDIDGEMQIGLIADPQDGFSRLRRSAAFGGHGILPHQGEWVCSSEFFRRCAELGRAMFHREPFGCAQVVPEHDEGLASASQAFRVSNDH